MVDIGKWRAELGTARERASDAEGMLALALDQLAGQFSALLGRVAELERGLNRAVFPETKPAGLESGEAIHGPLPSTPAGNLAALFDAHELGARRERERIAKLISDAGALAGEIVDTGKGIHPSWPLNVIAGHVREGATDPAALWAAWKPWARL